MSCHVCKINANNFLEKKRDKALTYNGKFVKWKSSDGLPSVEY